MFSVNIDKVTLVDPQKKEALNRLVREFARELVRAPLTKRQIKPDEAYEPVSCAARLALQARPHDVARILLNIAKNTLRKTGKVRKGTYPANMPLVIACLVDCIVTNERKKGNSKRFENTLGPLIYQIIFQRWVLGSIPGSQFLANLLLTWEHSGYFQPKHIEECKKPLWLLIAYAKADGAGVPDSPDKEKVAGWYRIVKREPGSTAGAEAICPRQITEQQVGGESVAREEPTTSPAAVASEPSPTAPTEPPKAQQDVGIAQLASSKVSAGPTEVMGPPAAASESLKPDVESVASTETQVMGPPAPVFAETPPPDSVSMATTETQVLAAPVAVAAEESPFFSVSMPSAEPQEELPSAEPQEESPAMGPPALAPAKRTVAETQALAANSPSFFPVTLASPELQTETEESSVMGAPALVSAKTPADTVSVAMTETQVLSPTGAAAVLSPSYSVTSPGFPVMGSPELGTEEFPVIGSPEPVSAERTPASVFSPGVSSMGTQVSAPPVAVAVGSPSYSMTLPSPEPPGETEESPAKKARTDTPSAPIASKPE